MNHHYLFIHFLLLLPGFVAAVAPDSTAPIAACAMATERERFKRELTAETIEANLQLSPAPENSAKFAAAFWGMELIGYRSALARQAIHRALVPVAGRSAALQRAALEAAFALYEKEFSVEMQRTVDSATTAKHFAIAAHYMLRLNPCKKERDILMARLQKRFNS